MQETSCLRKTLNEDLPRKSFVYRSVRVTAENRNELQRLFNDPCTVAVDRSTSIERTAKTSLAKNAPNDPLYPEQKHLRVLGYELYSSVLNPQTMDSKHRTLVAVVDDGGSLQHEDMQGQFWVNSVELLGVAGVDDDHNGFVDDIHGWNFDDNNNNVETTSQTFPHGSHVAGLIAALANNGLGVTGAVSSRVQMMTVNGLESIIPGFSEDPLVVASRAIQYAIDQKAQVINLSMGTKAKNEVLEAVLRQAVSKGVFVVASAGNDSFEIRANQPFSPAYYAKDLNGMLAVAATNVADGKESELCPFSNYSPSFVEISAPGCHQPMPGDRLGLWSTGLMSDPQLRYWRIEGTSMAAPLVSAAAAFVFSYIHEKTGVWPTNVLVENILKTSARKIPELQMKTVDGNALRWPELVRYIDREILQSPGCP